MALEDRQGPMVDRGLGGGSGCPDSETLARYVDGILGDSERREVESHLAGCGDCRDALAEATVFVRAEQETKEGRAAGARVVPFRSRRWVRGAAAALATAAAVGLVVRVERPEWMAGWFGPGAAQAGLQELVAAVAGEPRRPVEGRLTGGFRYAPPPSATRGSGDREASPDLRIAAARIEKLAATTDTPDVRALLGIASLTSGDLDKAVASLEQAANQQPDNANYQSDLSAAYLARARRQSRRDDLAKALEASRRARKLSPHLPDAAFNEALALEMLHLVDQARAAWTAYLQTYANDEWAAEARQRLGALDRLKMGAVRLRSLSVGSEKTASVAVTPVECLFTAGALSIQEQPSADWRRPA